MKLYIIANRFPLRAVPHKDTYTFVRSEGGLATGLDSLEMNCDKHWIGWPGMCVESKEAQNDIST